jgi:hypothetical protein
MGAHIEPSRELLHYRRPLLTGNRQKGRARRVMLSMNRPGRTGELAFATDAGRRPGLPKMIS